MTFSTDQRNTDVRVLNTCSELFYLLLPFPLFYAQDPLVPDGTFIHREDGGRL